MTTDTVLRGRLSEYHTYNCRLKATIDAGDMLAYPYPGGISWEDDERQEAVTISGGALASALADGAVIAPTSSTKALLVLPVLRWTSLGVNVSQLILCNLTDSSHAYSTDQVGPRLFTRNPIEFYS